MDRNKRRRLMQLVDNRTILIILLMVLVFFLLFKQCGENNGIEPGDSDIIIEEYHDTIIKTQIDTVFFTKTRTVTETELVYIDVIEDSSGQNKYYSFKSEIEDSLISGTILTQVHAKEDSLNLLYQNISYEPKFPKYIYRTDSVTIHDSTVVIRYDTKPEFFVGVDASFATDDSKGGIAPKIGVEFKDQYLIETGYDPFNKFIILGFKYKIKFKKNVR